MLVDHKRASQISQLALLRKAESSAAAEGLRTALHDYDTAKAVRDRQAAQCDEADSVWQHMIGAERPDPAFTRLAGSWLVSQERELEAEQLNLAIVRNRLAVAEGEYSQALAKQAAVKKICRKFDFAIAKYLDEVQSWNVIDAALRRWKK